MNSRRAFLASIVPAAAIMVTPAMAIEECLKTPDDLALDLANSLHLMHGGHWTIKVDHHLMAVFGHQIA